MNVKRICKNGQLLSHSDAAKVLRQLKTHPEVCENCNVKSCALATYLYESKKEEQENFPSSPCPPRGSEREI